MGQVTGIAWTDHTFNLAWGCTKVSEACRYCYAETWAKRYGVGWGPEATRRTFGEKHWREPLKWNAKAQREGIRRRVFCSSMADVFEDHPTITAERAKLWPLIEATPWLDWQLLTKRPERIVPTLEAERPMWLEKAAPNVWYGTTCEDQKSLDLRVKYILAVPAAVRFLSIEPMLEAVNAHEFLYLDDHGYINQGAPMSHDNHPERKWVIVGGESGHGARPCDLRWMQAVVDQCAEAGVACFLKQLGARFTIDGVGGWNAPGGYGSKGGDNFSAWPETVKVRQFPAVAA